MYLRATLIRAGSHDGILDDILNLFHVHGVAAGIADLLHMVADLDDLLLRQALGLGHDLIRLRDGRNDFVMSKTASLPLRLMIFMVTPLL